MDFSFQVGPIPVDDTIGKEVVTQITTPMLTNKSFFTDSNGRDFIKRVLKQTLIIFITIFNVCNF